MADFSNIPTGLNTTTQIPLYVKEFVANEATLATLGTDNYKAFTYEEGLRVKAIEEGTFWIWREVQPGEENTGLLPVDFTYPPNIVTFGITYSNRVFNFFPADFDYFLTSTGEGADLVATEIVTPNSKTFRIKGILSSTLTIAQGLNTISIDTPATASIPALYVNNLYEPTREEFLAGNTMGFGTIAKPFTDTIISYPPGGPVVKTANSAIQNALDVFAGGDKLNPALSGQKIIVQDNGGSGYTFDGDFNYLNLNIEFLSSVFCSTSGWLIDMDTEFGSLNIAGVVITLAPNIVLDIQNGLGMRNAGNQIATTTYATGKQISLLGKGRYQSNQNNINRTLFELDGDSNVNGSTGCNNDGNITFVVECQVFSKYGKIVRVGGKSRIEFNNDSYISSGTIVDAVDTNLVAFYQSGGIIRMFDINIGMNGIIRDNAFIFEPLNGFTPGFIVRNSRFGGAADVWFNKLNNNNIVFDVVGVTTLFFSGTQLFDSTNLWNLTFKNNYVESINIDFTKVDFTNGNSQSALNTIGNSVIETLVQSGNRTNAAVILPKYSKFLNTNNGNVSQATWFVDIVL